MMSADYFSDEKFEKCQIQWLLSRLNPEHTLVVYEADHRDMANIHARLETLAGPVCVGFTEASVRKHLGLDADNGAEIAASAAAAELKHTPIAPPVAAVAGQSSTSDTDPQTETTQQPRQQ